MVRVWRTHRTALAALLCAMHFRVNAVDGGGGGDAPIGDHSNPLALDRDTPPLSVVTSTDTPSSAPSFPPTVFPTASPTSPSTAPTTAPSMPPKTLPPTAVPTVSSTELEGESLLFGATNDHFSIAIVVIVALVAGTVLVTVVAVVVTSVRRSCSGQKDEATVVLNLNDVPVSTLRTRSEPLRVAEVRQAWSEP
eukprot:m.89001 g.89001  ORF g.89001 m.89001 type:complete len:194 (+) comp11693_c0_seq1:278-859(+)